jgi:hypothetical protein
VVLLTSDVVLLDKKKNCAVNCGLLLVVFFLNAYKIAGTENNFKKIGVLLKKKIKKTVFFSEIFLKIQ